MSLLKRTFRKTFRTEGDNELFRLRLVRKRSTRRSNLARSKPLSFNLRLKLRTLAKQSEARRLRLSHLIRPPICRLLKALAGWFEEAGTYKYSKTGMRERQRTPGAQGKLSEPC